MTNPSKFLKSFIFLFFLVLFLFIAGEAKACLFDSDCNECSVCVWFSCSTKILDPPGVPCPATLWDAGCSGVKRKGRKFICDNHGCLFDKFVYKCDESCGAECDGDSDCSDYCQSNTEYWNGDCGSDCTCSYTSRFCGNDFCSTAYECTRFDYYCDGDSCGNRYVTDNSCDDKCPSTETSCPTHANGVCDGDKTTYSCVSGSCKSSTTDYDSACNGLSCDTKTRYCTGGCSQGCSCSGNAWKCNTSTDKSCTKYCDSLGTCQDCTPPSCSKTNCGCCTDSYCSTCGTGECAGNYDCNTGTHSCTSICNTNGNSCGTSCNPACPTECCTRQCDGSGNCKTCTPPACVCECGNWTTRSCGYSTCSWYKKGKTRTCTPSGCDTEFKCVCSSSCCTNWTDEGCGPAGGCADTEMYQTRDCGTCDYSESQCVSDPSCGVVDNPPSVSIGPSECMWPSPCTRTLGKTFSATVSATDDVGLNKLYFQITGTVGHGGRQDYDCGGAISCSNTWNVVLDEITLWTFWGLAEDTAVQYSDWESIYVDVVPKCSDSDFGNDPETAGICTDTSSHNDSCSGNTLTEWECEEDSGAGCNGSPVGRYGCQCRSTTWGCNWYCESRYGSSYAGVCSGRRCVCSLACVADGDNCSTDGQCCSGYCVDGVCCNSACTGTCKRCDSYDGIAGTCHNIANNHDPNNECSTSWNSCDSTCVRRGGDGYCTGAGSCDTNDRTGNISSGYVCTGSGNQTAVSSSNYCNYDENCDNGDCSATKWWTSCNGSGSCRAASDHTNSYSENVYAQEGYTLTSTCGRTGTTACLTNRCRDGDSWHHKCDKRCDASHNCNYWIDSSCVDHCTNSSQDCDETGVDSGGSCSCNLNKTGNQIIDYGCVLDGAHYLQGGNLTITTGGYIQMNPNSSFTFDSGYEIRIEGDGYIMKSETKTIIQKQ